MRSASRLVVAFGLLATSAVAQTPVPSGAPAAEHTNQPAVPKDYPQFRWDDHPSLRLARGTRIDFRARFQGDLRGSDAPFDGEQDGAGRDLARRRVGVTGEIRNRVEFQVELELQATEPWRDVYANVKPYDLLQVQAGHFKLPFSLDENTSARPAFVSSAVAAARP